MTTPTKFVGLHAHDGFSTFDGLEPWEHESSKTFNSPEKLNFSQMVSHALRGYLQSSADIVYSWV